MENKALRGRVLEELINTVCLFFLLLFFFCCFFAGNGVYLMFERHGDFLSRSF